MKSRDKSHQELVKEKDELINQAKQEKFYYNPIEVLKDFSRECKKVLNALHKIDDNKSHLELEFQAYYPVCNIINKHETAEKDSGVLNVNNFFRSQKESESSSVYLETKEPNYGIK